MTEGDPFKKSSTMMGRGSDTRMYNPRSESSHMYRNNHEEDTYGLEDSEVRDEKREKKLREKEAEKKRKPKHIKIKPSDLPPDEEEDREDDSEKLDADRELSARTGPPGNLGFETSLAMGAKGPGAAAGNMFAMGESMEMTLAWDSLLKATGKEREKQRVREGRKEWRPSTGQFKTPPGGSLGPKGATGRRAKSQRRAVKRGRLTGMMDADKAVEMEHRGVSVKQPMSKFPGKYKEYQGQQEARRRLGQVRVPVSSQRRYGQRAYHAGQTGGGRLPGGMQQKPRIHSPRMSHSPSLPHLKKPSMPSAGLSMGKMGLPSMGQAPMGAVGAPPMPSMQQRPGQQFAMSSDKVAVSDILKARPTHSDIVELRSLVRQMRRALKNKDTTSKGMGDKDTDGAGEGKPKYRSNSFRNTSRPEGATEDATNDSRAFGVHPDSKGGPTP